MGLLPGALVRPSIHQKWLCPTWTDQMLTARDTLNTLAKLGISNVGALGTNDEVDPIKHLAFTAVGWGGMPLKNTFGILGSVARVCCHRLSGLS